MVAQTDGIIQIAGVRHQQEADLLVACGVDFIGFPLRLTVHREDLSEEAARHIIARLPQTVKAVLITYLKRAEEVLALTNYLQVEVVQLHGSMNPAEVKRLKNRRPNLKIIKSLIVRPGNFSALKQEMAAYSPWCDFFITDTFDPETGASGATGKTHDWAVSRRLVELSPLPLILAGGLRPDNVAEAIRQVRPAGVDAHTGVEDEKGAKDPRRVNEFVRNARAAFKQLKNQGEEEGRS